MSDSTSGQNGYVPFSLFRDRVDILAISITNLLDRDFPAALSKVEGLSAFLFVAMKVVRGTFDAIRHLASDIPKDSSPPLEYGATLSPLVRSILDVLFALVFISEDPQRRMEWYWRAGWRELREDFERHFNEYGGIAEWGPYLTGYQSALDGLAKSLGLTSLQTSQ